MLSPIPRRILRDTATFSVPTGFDQYQNPLAPVEYTVRNVHIQADNVTKISANNTEVTLSGILFIDARYSTPSVDYDALQAEAQKLGGEITCTVTSRHGAINGPFRVLTVDGLPDDEDNLHHWELGLV